MKSNAQAYVGFALGFVVGGMLTQSLMVVDTQISYTEGRNSVLNETVTLSGKVSTPCDLEIPVVVLAEMVEAGVLRWHEFCVKSVQQP